MSRKNAKELMLEFIAFSFRDTKKAAEMFAEDGAFEMSYLATFGVSSEYKGRDAIAGFFQFVRDLFPGLEFENIKVLIDEAGSGEYLPLVGDFMSFNEIVETLNRQGHKFSFNKCQRKFSLLSSLEPPRRQGRSLTFNLTPSYFPSQNSSF